MATKNITIEIDVYERLKALKETSESFSQVLRRTLPERLAGISAIDLLRMNEEPGGILKTSPEQLDEIERFRAVANTWRDPWTS